MVRIADIDKHAQEKAGHQRRTLFHKYARIFNGVGLAENLLQSQHVVDRSENNRKLIFDARQVAGIDTQIVEGW